MGLAASGNWAENEGGPPPPPPPPPGGPGGLGVGESGVFERIIKGCQVKDASGRGLAIFEYFDGRGGRFRIQSSEIRSVLTNARRKGRIMDMLTGAPPPESNGTRGEGGALYPPRGGVGFVVGGDGGGIRN